MTTPGIAGVVGIVMFIAGWWGGAEWQQRRPGPIAVKQVETNKPVGCQAIWVDRSSPDVWLRRWVYVTTSGKVIGEVSRGPGYGTSLAIRRDGSMLNQYLDLDAAKKAIEEDEAVKKECR